MKVANTRKVNERIIQYMSREQLNSLLGMGLSAPVSVDEGQHGHRTVSGNEEALQPVQENHTLLLD